MPSFGRSMMVVPSVAPRVAAANGGRDFDQFAALQAQDNTHAAVDRVRPLRADQHDMQAAWLERHALVRGDGDLIDVSHFTDAVLDGRAVQFDALVIGALGTDDGLFFIASIDDCHVSRVHLDRGWRPRYPGVLGADAFGRQQLRRRIERGTDNSDYKNCAPGCDHRPISPVRASSRRRNRSARNSAVGSGSKGGLILPAIPPCGSTTATAAPWPTL